MFKLLADVNIMLLMLLICLKDFWMNQSTLMPFVFNLNQQYKLNNKLQNVMIVKLLVIGSRIVLSTVKIYDFSYVL